MSVQTATGIVCAEVSLSHHVPSLKAQWYSFSSLPPFAYLLGHCTLFLDLGRVQSWTIRISWPASSALQPKERKEVSFTVLTFENARTDVK